MNSKGMSTGMFGWQVPYWAKGIGPAWEDIFRQCAEAGLDAVEIDPAPDMLAMARSFGLAVSGAYVGLPLHEPYEQLKLEQSVLPVAWRLAEAGGTDLVINADPKGGWDSPEPKTEEEFKRQGSNLSRISEAVRPYGLSVSLHNHAADAHNAEGDLRSVTAYASMEVGLCIDTGWAYTAGCDPIEWVRKYPERVAAFHLRNQLGPIPSEDLLEGDIDMRKLADTLSEIGYGGWLTLELWHREDTHPKRTMAEDAKRSVEYFHSFGI